MAIANTGAELMRAIGRGRHAVWIVCAVGLFGSGCKSTAETPAPIAAVQSPRATPVESLRSIADNRTGPIGELLPEIIVEALVDMTPEVPDDKVQQLLTDLRKIVENSEAEQSLPLVASYVLRFETTERSAELRATMYGLLSPPLRTLLSQAAQKALARAVATNVDDPRLLSAVSNTLRDIRPIYERVRRNLASALADEFETTPKDKWTAQMLTHASALVAEFGTCDRALALDRLALPKATEPERRETISTDIADIGTALAARDKTGVTSCAEPGASEEVRTSACAAHAAEDPAVRAYHANTALLQAGCWADARAGYQALSKAGHGEGDLGIARIQALFSLNRTRDSIATADQKGFSKALVSTRADTIASLEFTRLSGMSAAVYSAPSTVCEPLHSVESALGPVAKDVSKPETVEFALELIRSVLAGCSSDDNLDFTAVHRAAMDSALQLNRTYPSGDLSSAFTNLVIAVTSASGELDLLRATLPFVATLNSSPPPERLQESQKVRLLFDATSKSAGLAPEIPWTSERESAASGYYRSMRRAFELLKSGSDSAWLEIARSLTDADGVDPDVVANNVYVAAVLSGDCDTIALAGQNEALLGSVLGYVNMRASAYGNTCDNLKDRLPPFDVTESFWARMSSSLAEETPRLANEIERWNRVGKAKPASVWCEPNENPQMVLGTKAGATFRGNIEVNLGASFGGPTAEILVDTEPLLFLRAPSPDGVVCPSL